MDTYGEMILFVWLGMAGVTAMALLVLVTLASFFIGLPVWLAALISIGGGFIIASSRLAWR